MRRRESVAIAVIVVLAVVGLLASAYPAYEYTRAASVEAELTACAEPDGKRVRCTATWERAGGERCEVRLWANARHQRETGSDHLHVEGCTVRGPFAPAFFAAMLVVLVIVGVIWSVRRLRGRP
ncbi:hypothetical protein GCM10010411_44120 [Actinomadura fulvescens]|uniref:DUF4333 domain-containing protein n=2 Tax=Actinomadura fulvescens TaxID=46160 RepID=A0ABP6CAI9_9ACTN